MRSSQHVPIDSSTDAVTNLSGDLFPGHFVFAQNSQIRDFRKFSDDSADVLAGEWIRARPLPDTACCYQRSARLLIGQARRSVKPTLA